MLKAAVSAQGGTVVAVRGLPLGTEGGFQAVRMEMTARAAREQIQGIVQGIEASAPVVFFERIKLTAAEGTGTQDLDVIEMTATLRVLAVIAAPKAARR